MTKQTLQVAYEKARKLIDRFKLNNKKYYDQRSNPIEISINDKVLVRKEPYDKHGSMYAGPFIVTRVNNPNISIRVNDKIVEIHKNRIIKPNNLNWKKEIIKKKPNKNSKITKKGKIYEKITS